MNNQSLFIREIFHSNPDYLNDDLNWIDKCIENNFEKVTQSVQGFYKALTLLYRQTYCGYFSQLYNYEMVGIVKSQNESKFIEMLSNPVFHELDTNTYLNEEEQTLLLNILYLEMLSINLTLVKFCLRESSLTDLYTESYNELYTKMYRSIIPEDNAFFDDFVTLGKFSPKIKANRAYSFPLLDIVMVLTVGVDHQLINKNNRSHLEDKYKLEIKLMKVTADRAREIVVNEIGQ